MDFLIIEYFFGGSLLLYVSLMMQVSSKIVRLQKEVSRTFILSNHHSPRKMHWDLAVKKALEIINRSSTPLTKVLTIITMPSFGDKIV